MNITEPPQSLKRRISAPASPSSPPPCSLPSRRRTVTAGPAVPERPVTVTRSTSSRPRSPPSTPRLDVRLAGQAVRPPASRARLPQRPADRRQRRHGLPLRHRHRRRPTAPRSTRSRRARSTSTRRERSPSSRPTGSHSFGYWHIVPAVTSHQFVHRHQLLGTIAQGLGTRPLRRAPRRRLRQPAAGRRHRARTSTTQAPTVTSVSLSAPTLVAVASDTPDPVVPGAWAGEPVTPALIDVKIGRGTWQTAVDFRTAMLPRSEFSSVYTPATRQNHKGEPGCFSFYLVSRVSSGDAGNGPRPSRSGRATSPATRRLRGSGRRSGGLISTSSLPDARLRAGRAPLGPEVVPRGSAGRCPTGRGRAGSP